MLSRVADALFWMSRYLERAEHVARLLDVAFHGELDLYGLASETEELDDVLTILQTTPPETARSPRHWLTFDPANPNSIMSCVNKARSNARSIRGTISTVLWRELNKLYWQLRDPEFTNRAMDSPHDFYAAVEVGSHLVQGICNATMVRDEGWHFIKLGMFLERAEKTLRILDVKCLRNPIVADAPDTPVAHLRWAGVLRSCLAYEAFQRLYISRVEPERVVEFLLLEERFPRSVRFSLEGAARALDMLQGRPAERGEARADRILGRILSELRFGDVHAILAEDLHSYFQRLLQSCWQTSATIQSQFALVTSVA